MKRFAGLISILLAVCMLASLAACGSASEEIPGEAPSEAAAAAEASGQTEAADESQVVALGAMEGDEFGNAAVGANAAVSSFSEVTSQVGIDILQAGGNAVDAAIATIFAVGVCEPHHSGIGGSGLMTIYLADEDRYTTIEYMEAIPMNYDGTYTKANDNQNARAAGVPGQVAGLMYALEKYGTMTPAEVLAPAIKLAREGFELDFVVAGAIADEIEIFSQPGYEYQLGLYTWDGIPYSAGDILVNEDLANTLEKIAQEGADGFYKGEVAEKLVEGMQAEGNWITMEDLANYEPKEREPVSTDYYGYSVYGCNYPTCGGVWEMLSLNIMESMDIASYEQGSADYWKIFNEALRIGAYDAYTYFGDVDNYDLPVDELTSKEYASERAKIISLETCHGTTPASDLGDAKEYGINGDTSIDDDTSTTHIVAMDSSGNVVSSTNTLGYSFGCTYAVEGLGFCLNNHMLNHNNVPNGGHLKSSMSPTIVSKDGTPVLAVGSPGSRVIPCVIMSVINNTLLYGMSVQEAINAVRCFAMTAGSKYQVEPTLTAETDRMSSGLIRQLEIYGYTFIEGLNEYDQRCGGIAAIGYNPEDGLLYAGGDPRRGYMALAY